MRKSVLNLTRAAVIAALYVILTFISNAFGLASNAFQVRLSEILTILPAFTPAGIYGVTVGCLLSNILTGSSLYDDIFGTIATLLGAIGTYFIGRKNKFLAPLPPFLSNTLIIPFVLFLAYGLKPLWLFFITVGAGELISCYILGVPFYCLVKKYRKALGFTD